MRILIVFATRYGHARKLARFVAAQFSEAGHDVHVHDAAERPWPDPTRFGAALLVGALHMVRLPAPLHRFAQANREALNQMRSGLICISMAAAGVDPSDRTGLYAAVARFERRAGWRPRAVHHAAGDMRFSAYDPLTRWIIAWIARRRCHPVERGQDYDLTDYVALAAFAKRFVTEEAA